MKSASCIAALCAALLFPALMMGAQPSVRYVPDKKLWVLETKNSAYVLGVDDQGSLQSLYWGGALWRDQDWAQAHTKRDLSSFDPRQNMENEEYPGWGGPLYTEPSLKVTTSAGVRDVVLRYASHSIEGNSLRIEMRDVSDKIGVTLSYVVYPETGIIRKQSIIHNGTAAPITLESAQSGAWYLPTGTGYRLTYVNGRWAAETQLVHEPIHPGVKVLESRKGHTGHEFNPWFMIDGGNAEEESGEVWFGALGWSGNWRIAVEQTPYQQVRVTGGLNPFDFSYPLQPGESLETPPFYGGYSANGFGAASRLLHDFERTDILPHGAAARLRPVLYNSWEATGFNVNEEGQESLAEKAAKIGVELFVMDDGWFGARKNDHAGLGDWVVNKTKFPQDLQPMIAKINSLGMDFGLWVEPEMVNADSDLYRQHPDWVLNFPGRPRSELRNQMVLNLAREDVREYVFGFLDRLASSYHIRYMKWDMNRPFSEPGWNEAGVPNERKMWVEYVHNLYQVIDRLRAKHPQLEIETCSGGGGRVDLAMLRRTDEAWTSDNTEAFDRLRIQQGFSYAYTAKVMSAWVTDVPNMNGRSTPLQYRFLVAMQGALGVGANLNKWAADDFDLATRMIAYDKQIRGTVQNGNLYRLLPPDEGDYTANQYVAADGNQAVLFGFLHSQQFRQTLPAVKLRGLTPNAIYRVKPFDKKLGEKQETLSGAYLMNEGLHLLLRGDYDSTSVMLERVQ